MYSLHAFLRRYCEAPRSRRASDAFEHPVAGKVPLFRVSPPAPQLIDVPFAVVGEVRVTFPSFSPEVVE